MSTLALRLAPFVFVIIWATGFIVARLVAPHAEPLTFLVVRYGSAALVVAAIAALARAPWPKSLAQWRDGLVAGVLLHGFYLGGVFWAVRHGLPAGIAALVAGLQPLLTGLLVGPFLGERVPPRRWAGIGLGFLGAGLVILPKLGGAGGLEPLPLAVAFAGVTSITFGTIWQKRAGGGDLRTNAAVQYMGAALLTLPLALVLEDGQFDASAELLVGLAWAVLGISVGGVLLFLLLIRRGALAGVASLLYLVPPVAAVMAYLGFGETLNAVQIAGMVVASAGVALANRS